MEGKGVTVKEWRLKGKRKEEKGRDLLYDQFHNLRVVFKFRILFGCRSAW